MSRPRRIVHIGTADNSGGAARAAYRLHAGLLREGCDSRMLVGQRVTHDASTASTRPDWRWKAADRLAALGTEAFGLQDVWYPTMRRVARHPWVRNADLIQFHNLHGKFFAFPQLASLTARAPGVWYLHDMWALTGHCVYSYDCDRWKIGCGRCPILREDYLPLRYDTTALHWRIKASVYRRSRLTIVVGSRWMEGMARESPLLRGMAVHHVPYPVDTDVYRPLPRAVVREALGLDPAGRYILLMAHLAATDDRKGGRFFVEAARSLHREGMRDVTALIVGDTGEGQRPDLGIPVRYYGSLHDDRLMAQLYAASDLFVLPTLADNSPLTVMESLAAGTPVVAFASGGVPELIRHMETGYLAPRGDAEALALGIRTLLADPQPRATMGQAARTYAVQEHDIRVHVARMLDVYDSVLGSNTSGAKRAGIAAAG